MSDCGSGGGCDSGGDCDIGGGFDSSACYTVNDTGGSGSTRCNDTGPAIESNFGQDTVMGTAYHMHDYTNTSNVDNRTDLGRTTAQESKTRQNVCNCILFLFLLSVGVGSLFIFAIIIGSFVKRW